MIIRGNMGEAQAPSPTNFGLVWSRLGDFFDRIVHAQLEADETLTPLQLVARAETELRMVGKPGGRSPVSLLD